MEISPDASPNAAKENATGRPSSKNATKAANIAGAMNSIGLMAIEQVFRNGQQNQAVLIL